MAQRARDQGVVVSVVTIDGEECGMENLGICADITSGQVDIVDPLTLKSTVSTLMASSILARNASSKLILPKQLTAVAGETQMEFGNVLRTSDFTLAFAPTAALAAALKKSLEATNEELSEQGGEAELEALAALQRLPIQLQLRFTKNSGEECLRVITQTIDIGHRRAAVEASMNGKVVALDAIHQAAQLAIDSQYREARILLVSTQRLLQRAMKTAAQQADYLAFIVQAEKLDQFIRESEAHQAVFGEAKTRDDDAAKSLFQVKRLSAAAFVNHQ